MLPLSDEIMKKKDKEVRKVENLRAGEKKIYKRVIKGKSEDVAPDKEKKML